MKLEKLKLVNYRAFKQLNVGFEAGVTVIAGINCVGKSSILNAIAVSLSRALPKLTQSRSRGLSMGATDVYLGEDMLDDIATLDHKKATIEASVSFGISLSDEKVSELIDRRNRLRFECRTESDPEVKQALESEIDGIKKRLNALDKTLSHVQISPQGSDESSRQYSERAKDDDRQPIAVYYSTSRFLSRMPRQLSEIKNVGIAAAYTKALSGGEISLNDFANWYRVLKASKNKERSEEIFGEMERSISRFLKGVKELKLDTTGKKPRFSVQKRGKTLYLDQLSDGEQGLLALVFDLTRRLTIANPVSENPVKEGEAIVLIDEIELHLHPSWQRKVVNILRKVFKSCQFVITTHSPIILGEVRADCIRYLYDKRGKIAVKPLPDVYGLDANRILKELMDAPTRKISIEQKFRKLFKLIDDEEFEDAREIMEKLRENLGENEPEITRASVLLKFLEGDK